MVLKAPKPFALDIEIDDKTIEFSFSGTLPRSAAKWSAGLGPDDDPAEFLSAVQVSDHPDEIVAEIPDVYPLARALLGKYNARLLQISKELGDPKS